MLQSILFFVAGVALLIWGARWLVDGASSLARRLGVSTLMVGLTVVALGTSMPELVVNLIASVKAKGDIVIGNVVGSNISNILLMLGISAMIFPLRVKVATVWKEIPLGLLAVLAVAVMANDVFLDGVADSALSRADGIILIFFFIIFLAYIYSAYIAGVREAQQEGPQIKLFGLPRSVAMVCGGLILLFVGGRLTVEGASAIALALGVSEALIGFSIVAIGTSLPELAASAVAAYKRQVDIAVGNIVGSNIFNIFFILGTSALIRAIPFSPAFNMDLFFLTVATLLLFFALFVGKRHIMERWQGASFVGLYILYLTFLIARG